MDIASSNFSEETTIFGGNRNFNTGITNIISQYHPKVIAIASTCLAETIGEDVPRMINEYREVRAKDAAEGASGGELPVMLYASTPSYAGTHFDGFHQAVYAAVKELADAQGKVGRHVNLFCNFISPEDIRHLKEIALDFGVETMLFPDYSDTLDGVSLDAYQRIPEGGTKIEALRRSGSAMLSVELGHILNSAGKYGRQTAGEYLQERFDVVLRRVGLPLGINETDRFFALLQEISGKETPEKYLKQRGRLIDLYIDGHKYVSNKRAAVYADEDVVVGLAAFLAEIGVKPVMIASGGESGKLKTVLQETLGELWSDEYQVRQGMTFGEMEEALSSSRDSLSQSSSRDSLSQREAISNSSPREAISTPSTPIDLMVGNSKGYYIARKLDVPFVRVGFPIHDRIGAQHQKTLGYEGATILFEQIVNAILEDKQRKSSVVWKYM
jgi:nitrogenase molybdenum-iron protein NifN